MSHQFGGPPDGVSILEWYTQRRPPPPTPTPTPGTYQGLNTKYSQEPTPLPLPIGFVPGGCWVGDSARNEIAIRNFTNTKGEGADPLQMVVYIAGHAGIINPHQSRGEPKIVIGCYTFYFNYAGELTFLPGTATPNGTSNAFMSNLSHVAPFDKNHFFEYLKTFKDRHITAGSPLSLYEPFIRMDDSNVLCGGGVSIDDTHVNSSGRHVFHSNPASVHMFVKDATGHHQIIDLTIYDPNIIDVWKKTSGDLQIRLKADGSGYEHEIAPYLYLNPDGTYRNVRLSDIYKLIKVAIRHLQPDTATHEHLMNEFLHRHVVLVSGGCRVLGDGTVYRVESTSPQPHHADHALMHSNTASVPRSGGKKKQRRRQTRNRKYKLSKKKSTKRVRRS